MKKLFTAIVATMIVSVTFAQPTPPQVPVPDFVQKRQTSEELSNAEVQKYLDMSKEGLQIGGVPDLDKVYPGQFLQFVFTFENGNTGILTHTVEEGDNIWNIIKYKLAQLIRQNGQPIPYVEPVEAEDADAGTPSGTIAQAQLSPSWYFDADNIALTILFLLIATIIGVYLYVNRRRISAYFAEQRRRKLTDNPVVPGGVDANGARAHMNTLAQQYFPGLNVTNIVRGRLTAENALVSFADKLTGKTRSFENEPGYRGTLGRENGTEEYIYFLEICGNRARQGNYYSGDILFIADVEQPAVLRFTPQTNLQQDANTVAPESPATIAAIINAVTEPMKGKDSGKLKVRVGNVEIEMEFNSAPKTQNLLLNGTTKDQMAITETTAQ